MAILPYIKSETLKVFMQLRDFKPDIACPGCWGFFSGAIDPGETPLEAANRELKEELGLTGYDLKYLSSDYLWDLDNAHSDSFYFKLDKEISEIKQFEGVDSALVSLQDVLDNKIYSKAQQKYFPPAPTYYVAHMFNKLIEVVK